MQIHCRFRRRLPVLMAFAFVLSVGRGTQAQEFQVQFLFPR
jgi:hypothetical protein